MATAIVELAKAREADLTLVLVEEPEAHLHPSSRCWCWTFCSRFFGKLCQALNNVSRPISGQNLSSSGLVTAFELRDLFHTALFRGFAILGGNGIRLD
jgi:hypothetical protein